MHTVVPTATTLMSFVCGGGGHIIRRRRCTIRSSSFLLGDGDGSCQSVRMASTSTHSSNGSTATGQQQQQQHHRSHFRRSYASAGEPMSGGGLATSRATLLTEPTATLAKLDFVGRHPEYFSPPSSPSGGLDGSTAGTSNNNSNGSNNNRRHVDAHTKRMFQIPQSYKQRHSLRERPHIRSDTIRERRYALCRRCGHTTFTIGFNETPSARLGLMGHCVGGADFSHHQYTPITAKEYELLSPVPLSERLSRYLFKEYQ